MIKNTKLSARRTQYIEHRLAGHEPKTAARLANYTNPQGNHITQLEKHPEVIAAIRKQQEKLQEKMLWTREKAVKELLHGIKIAKLTDDAQSIRSCVQELNKMHGFHMPDKTEIVHTHSVVIKQLENLDDEALLSKIGGETALIEGEVVDNHEQ